MQFGNHFLRPNFPYANASLLRCLQAVEKGRVKVVVSKHFSRRKKEMNGCDKRSTYVPHKCITLMGASSVGADLGLH